MVEKKQIRLAKFVQLMSNSGGKGVRDLNALDEDGFVWVYVTRKGDDRYWQRLNPERRIPSNQVNKKTTDALRDLERKRSLAEYSRN
jgi:hypothetical protein